VDPVRETAFEWFKSCVVEVWGKWPEHLDLKLSPEAPSEIEGEHPLASLAYARTARPMAVGRHLISYPSEATLRISDRLLTLPPEKIRKILLHEAAHLGYSGHGAEFRAVAREVGATVSESGLDDDVVQVQKKVGARFKTVRTFPGVDERAAQAWTREQAKAEPGSRWRMLMGYDEDVGDLDGKRASKDDRPLWVRMQEAVDEGDPRDFLWAAREIEPDVDENDVEAVKLALMAYIQNEIDLARERGENV